MDAKQQKLKQALDTALANFKAAVTNPPAPSVCSHCNAPPLHECEDGAIYSGPADRPAARICPALVARNHQKRVIDALMAAGVGDSIHAKVWDEMEIVHPSWKLAREYGRNVTEVIDSKLNLVFIGDRGTGKTQAAKLICADAVAAGRTAYAVEWAEFAKLVRSTYQSDAKTSEHQLLKAVTSADIALLDEIDNGERGHTARLLDEVLRLRYSANRPTILTANLSKSELLEAIGERAASRLEAASDWVIFNGPRYRQQIEGARVAGLIEKVRKQAK